MVAVGEARSAAKLDDSPGDLPAAIHAKREQIPFFKAILVSVGVAKRDEAKTFGGNRAIP